MPLTNPNYLVDTTFSAKNISSPVSVYTWTVAASVKAQIIFGMTVAAAGTYIVYITRQWAGAGSTYIIQPKSQAALLAGETTPEFVSALINFKTGDVVNVMVQGLAADTNISGVIRIVADNPSVLEAIDVDTLLTTNHGTGAWNNCAGSGSVTFDYVVTDSVTSNPVSGVTTWVTTDIAGTNIIAAGITDALGTVRYYLDPGTYYVWRNRADYSVPITDPNPDTITVV
jgi:hypothetical protein